MHRAGAANIQNLAIMKATMVPRVELHTSIAARNEPGAVSAMVFPNQSINTPV